MYHYTSHKVVVEGKRGGHNSKFFLLKLVQTKPAASKTNYPNLRKQKLSSVVSAYFSSLFKFGEKHSLLFASFLLSFPLM